MPTRRLDDRIREICGQISAVGRDPHSTDQEVEILLKKLQEAIHEKVQRVRIIATNKLLQGNDADKQDRAKSLGRTARPLGQDRLTSAQPDFRSETTVFRNA
jgi:hypothetical protein